MAFGAEMKDFVNAFKVGWTAMAEAETSAFKKAATQGFSSPKQKREFDAAKQAGLSSASERKAQTSAIPVNSAYTSLSADDEEYMAGQGFARGGVVEEQQPAYRAPPMTSSDPLGEDRGNSSQALDQQEGGLAQHHEDLIGAMKAYAANPTLPPRRPGETEAQAPQRYADMKGESVSGWTFLDLKTAEEATDEGLKWLQNKFLQQPAQSTALPQQSDKSAGMRAFARGVGAASPAEYQAASQTVDPQNKLSEDEKVMATLNAGYKFWLGQGEPEKAKKYAASMLMYTKTVASSAGAMAQTAAQNNDADSAAKWIQKAQNYITDGKSLTYKTTEDGSAVNWALIDNKTKKKVDGGKAGLNDLMYIATGMQNGTAWLEQVSAVGSQSSRRRGGGGRGRGGRRSRGGRSSSGGPDSNLEALDEARDAYTQADEALGQAQEEGDETKIAEAKAAVETARKNYMSVAAKNPKSLVNQGRADRALGIKPGRGKASGDVDVESAQQAQDELREAQAELAKEQALGEEGDVTGAQERVANARNALAELTGNKGVGAALGRQNTLAGERPGRSGASALPSSGSRGRGKTNQEPQIDLIGAAQSDVDRLAGRKPAGSFSSESTSRTYPKEQDSVAESDQAAINANLSVQRQAETRLNRAKLITADRAYNAANSGKNIDIDWDEDARNAVKKEFTVTPVGKDGKLPANKPPDVPDDVLQVAEHITQRLAKRNDMPVGQLARATRKLMAGDGGNFDISRDGTVNFGTQFPPIVVDRWSLQAAAAIRGRQQPPKSIDRESKGLPGQGSEMKSAVDNARKEAIDLGRQRVETALDAALNLGRDPNRPERRKARTLSGR